MPETAGTMRTIGGLEFDVTVQEVHTDRLEITSHPVQKGAAISDHAYKLPMELSVTVGKGAIDDADAPRQMYDDLVALQESREPIEITTGKRDYENFLIRSISVVTDVTTENVLLVRMDLQEIITVETQTASVSGKGTTVNQGQSRKTQTTQNGGEKQAKPDANNGGKSDPTGASDKKKSILATALNR